MALLFYVRLIALTAGTLVYLFLLALILGHRRPRRFERLLFLLILSLFAIYAGGLLEVNAVIQYGAPPAATQRFAHLLVASGLIFLLPLILHSHVEYMGLVRQKRLGKTSWAAVAFVYLLIPAQLIFVAVMSHKFGIRFGPALANFANTDPLGNLAACAVVAALMQFAVSRAERNHRARNLAKLLFSISCLMFAIFMARTLYTEAGSSFLSDLMATASVVAGVLPGAVLIYYMLKHNFLEFGAQRNLVYALSATVLALLYLALVHRVSGWLAPVFPPEATASVLLFVLIFLFEPLERAIGPVLHRRFRERMSGLQNLTLDLQQEARQGDLARLISHAEQRIREEFGLAAVRISIPRDASRKALESPGGLGHVVRMPLMKDHQEVGLLEAASTGSYLTGETSAGLEFLAEQLLADGRSLPLDRRKSTAGARIGGARASRGSGTDGGERFAQFAKSAQLDEDGFASAA